MIRRLLALLLLGALLGLGRGAIGGWLGEDLVVVVAAGEDLDEAILLDQGLRAGWVRTDPVIRRRLVQDLEFAGQTGTEAELVEQGIALGMPTSDPVIRRRLIHRARGLLERPVGVAPSPPRRSDAVVEPVLEVRQVPLDDAGERRALPALEPVLRGTEAQIAGRMGWGFVEGLGVLSIGDRAELTSTWGRHEVILLDRRKPDRDPDRADDRSVRGTDPDAAYAARMAALRARYRVVQP